MRTLLVTLLVFAAACGDDGSELPVDAKAADAPAIDARLVDARLVDAPMIDAPAIDAPAGSVAAACMHACDALGVCFMDSDPSCVGECSADLADCTAQQVQEVEACTTMACGDQTASPIIDCLSMVACVQM